MLGVQNSESALKNRLMFLKKATAGKKESSQVHGKSFLLLFDGLHSLLLASHSALSTPGGNAARGVTSVCVIRWLTYCCCRYGRSSRLLLIPLEETTRG